MDVWVGLVRVSSLPGADVFGGNRSALVKVLAPATGVETFQSAAAAALADLQLIAAEFEDVAPLPDGKSVHGRLDDELWDVAEEARRTGRACFCSFHTYPHEDA